MLPECCDVFTSKINLHHIFGRIQPFNCKELIAHITRQLHVYFIEFRKIFNRQALAKKKLKFFLEPVRPPWGKVRVGNIYKLYL